MHGQEDHLGDDPRRLQRSERFDAVHPGHRDVRDDDVRLKADRSLHQAPAIADSTDDVHLLAQQTDQFLHDQSMIVGDQDSGATCVLFQDDLLFRDLLAGDADHAILRPCRRKREPGCEPVPFVSSGRSQLKHSECSSHGPMTIGRRSIRGSGLRQASLLAEPCVGSRGTNRARWDPRLWTSRLLLSCVRWLYFSPPPGREPNRSTLMTRRRRNRRVRRRSSTPTRTTPARRFIKSRAGRPSLYSEPKRSSGRAYTTVRRDTKAPVAPTSPSAPGSRPSSWCRPPPACGTWSTVGRTRTTRSCGACTAS